PDRTRYRDRVGHAFVGMDASEIDKPAAGLLPRSELGEVDAVINGRDVGQVRIPVGIADRDVRDTAGVAPVDRSDAARREPVDRRHDWGRDESGVGQGKKVIVIVYDVEVSGLLEGVRDMQRLPHLRIERGIFREWPRTDRVEMSLRDAVRGCEQRHVDTTLDSPLLPE